MIRTLSAALLLLLLPFPLTGATASSFLGRWTTQWQTLDHGGTIAADLVVRLDTSGEQTLLDGEYTTIDATTKAEVKGWMHGHLSANGKVWSGAWWNADAREHGDFTFTLTGKETFVGTYSQARHGRKSFAWNGRKQ